MSSAEVEVQTSSQTSRKEVVASRSSRSSKEALGQRKQVLEGRPVTSKGHKPVVKASIHSALCGMKNPIKPALDGRAVTERLKPTVKAPSVCSKLCEMDHPDTRKLAPEPPTSSPTEPPARATTTYDMLVPPHMGCRLQRASWRLRRERDFVTSTPRSFLSSALSPPEIQPE
jgi:hypothetical protein